LSTALVSDAHLGGPGGAAAPLVVQLGELAGQGAKRVVFLGDLFQIWVGAPKYETPEIVETMAALAALRRQGIELAYLEGNRDFFLAGSAYAAYFDHLGLEYAFVEGGRRYLAVHGDGLNDRDRKYRFWRWLSKSAPSRFFARHLPPRLAWRLMRSTEQGLSRTNFKHKIYIPELVLRAYGERRLAEGHDVLLLGHFHEPRSWRVAGGEVRIVEAWFTSRRIEWLS